MSVDRFYALKLPDGYLFTSKREGKTVLKLALAANIISILVLLALRKTLKYLLVVLLVDYFVCKSYVVEERLMMLENFGLQIESKTLGNFKNFNSIPIQSVQHLLINEAFLMQEIVFYLLIVLNDSKTIVLPFKKCRIDLENLKKVYNCFNELFDHDTKGNAIKYVP
ncbi:conserved hypothetical protein [Theileria orientalis strain Shintoku]|uniref:Phosphatidylinositol N-acetylglucosaminyltransferase subunit H conserved domain-containing protein n=1 Tax=Theileria orientalis strain Shintoku TaxID=869250 RepID=J4C8D5_THEOR|nr:conserved hypothetical protein [Theileria orientalis strain Shintoku]PVC53374.1 hypothetical protein MACL_00000119 [Theileria orientalis]BAM40598.1 conserved hypothetical protein [Theileria orientalis strain Shintoku]|eukprot:XP_009690899.1 conserved hypothetical protein [Theileria orientalis strain Shintoku]